MTLVLVLSGFRTVSMLLQQQPTAL